MPLQVAVITIESLQEPINVLSDGRPIVADTLQTRFSQDLAPESRPPKFARCITVGLYRHYTYIVYRHLKMPYLMTPLPTLLFPSNRGTELTHHSHLLTFRHWRAVDPP